MGKFLAAAPCFTIPMLVLLIVGCAARPFYPLPSRLPEGSRQPLQTTRPYNIAHRGSNGEFPEETLPAYKRAIEEGADFIETDVLSSKDGVLICFHDVTLDQTTDVGKYKKFANRRRTYDVQGVNITGFFTVDFTLKELQSLKVKQRYPFRDQQHNGKFSIITFEDFIAIALDAPRVVGIYPEIKNPVFINQRVKWRDGKIFEDKFVEILKKHGYKDLPQILLIDDTTIPTQDTNQTYWEITSDSYFNYIKKYVVGIGPWKDTIVPAVNNYMLTPTDLVTRAHTHNLQVHPYTFRNEYNFVHFNFHQDSYEEFDYWINTIRVDGIFTDFTGSLHHFKKWTSNLPPNDTEEQNASDLLHKISVMLNPYRS
ncbi:Glycerophosphodiester phosphodiesterase GDPD5, partial [Cucurbita argyrosperma subsp. sororia]